MQVRKQQLDLDMEQQTGSKYEKEFVKAVYCHPAYLTYMQTTSWEMLEFCMRCLYILNINNWSCHLQILEMSASICCLFILLMVSFAVQKLLSLIKSPLFIFALSYEIAPKNTATICQCSVYIFF